jgi:hypothetical protein
VNRRASGQEPQSALGSRCLWGTLGNAMVRLVQELASSAVLMAPLRKGRNDGRHDVDSRRVATCRLRRWWPRAVQDRRAGQTGWRERGASGNYAT